MPLHQRKDFARADVDAGCWQVTRDVMIGNSLVISLAALPYRASWKEQLGCGIDDCLSVEAVSAVKIGKVASLTKAVGAERADAVAANPAEP